MRIGVLSDVHGNHAALAAALRALENRVDQWVFLGDLTGYYPFVRESLALLDARPMVAIRGNHDDILLDAARNGTAVGDAYRSRYGSALERARVTMTPAQIDRLGSWPLSRAVELGGMRLLLAHGAPWDPRDGRVYPDFTEWSRFEDVDADGVLLGHTHYALVHAHKDILIVNPGSVGQARDRSGAASCAVLDTVSRTAELIRVPYNAAEIVADARAHDADLPYLHEVLSR